MPAPKFFADLLTSLRACIAFALVWLGLSQGASAIEMAVYLMLASWISDFFDGFLARKSKRENTTWIGSHDLEIDVLVSLGLLAYLTFSSYLPRTFSLIYILLWAFFFSAQGISKSYGSLVQAPIYIYFVWLAWKEVPVSLRYVAAWFAGNLLFTWRRFIFRVIPEFFTGLRGNHHAPKPS